MWLNLNRICRIVVINFTTKNMISTSMQTMTFVLLMATILFAAAIDSTKANKEAADSKAIETLVSMYRRKN